MKPGENNCQKPQEIIKQINKLTNIKTKTAPRNHEINNLSNIKKPIDESRNHQKNNQQIKDQQIDNLPNANKLGTNRQIDQKSTKKSIYFNTLHIILVAN